MKVVPLVKMWSKTLHNNVFPLASEASAGSSAGSARSKEAASSRLTSGVSTGAAAACCTAHAVKDSRKCQTSDGCPHEAKSLAAETGGLAVVIEVVASLDVAGTTSN